MIESLATLAAAASTTLVAAMATDAWQTARTGILRVLRRGAEHEPGALAAQLDSEAALVVAADDAGAARESLQPGWRLRLEQFLRDNPEAAEAIRELTVRLEAELPGSEQQWVRYHQNVEAHDNARAFGVQNGNVIIHEAPAAGPVTPSAGGVAPSTVTPSPVTPSTGPVTPSAGGVAPRPVTPNTDPVTPTPHADAPDAPSPDGQAPGARRDGGAMT
ncbi:hypothetical protein ACIO6U_13180 [Streptomyces sp. NPDC087422]|uniref:hypothetical protein n=1 Tax=Streptomyces sp. NPDC087422 TaxID=3365786 RepID=UPI003810B9BC